MCGIFGRVGHGDVLPDLLQGLNNLEYRGYDSAGIAVQSNGSITIQKKEGETEDLEDAVSTTSIFGSIGIGHTRWSTHGKPSDENAHPHSDCNGRIAVVHNGIIQNHAELRQTLKSKGHAFSSDTDTEVVPHLIGEYLNSGCSIKSAFRQTVEHLEGNFAIAMISAGENAIYAAKRKSPLVIGLGEDSTYIASDVPAFLEFTDEVIYLEDNDFAVLTPKDISITTIDERPVERSIRKIDWNAEDADKGLYNHYMRKEIDEQPVALRQTLEGRINDSNAVFDSLPDGVFADTNMVVFVACGTSYHAAMYGCILFQRRGIPAVAMRANEFEHDPMPLFDDTLVVAVTQSGETADTLGSLRVASKSPAQTLAITNVMGSSATRIADQTLFLRSGPEIGVAATKTFSSQATILALLANRMLQDRAELPRSSSNELSELHKLPKYIDQVLSDGSSERIARLYDSADSYFFVGRGVGYPVALEGALKFKEITYEHAEGFAAGELKHGPLALITSGTVLIAVFTGRNDEKTLHNVREAQSRGAPVVGIGPPPTIEIRETVDEYIEIPETYSEYAGIVANVHLQLLAYHAARLRGREIDKPRNLAKSVTVE